MAADFWELVSASPAGGMEGVVSLKSNVDVQLDQRHLMLRGEDVSCVTFVTMWFVNGLVVVVFV